VTEASTLVNPTAGTQRRKIYADPAVYQAEMARIFARCWLFLAHESQIPTAGDFFRTFMGEDEVLVVRQQDRSIKAFLNTCTHRGNRLVRAIAATAVPLLVITTAGHLGSTAYSLRFHLSVTHTSTRSKKNATI